MMTRVRLSLYATIAGWAAATLLTLVFESWELARNAPPGGLLLDLASGFTLWASFTLAICAVVWCFVVLPVALAVPATTIVRGRLPLAVGASLSAVALIGWKLGTWSDLGHPGPSNPVKAPLFLAYAGFGFVLGGITTLVYARLLRRTLPSP